eukprot:929862_1
MSNQGQSGANLQKLVGVGTAVVGGIALMTKLGIDEMQHRQMKQKTDPSNAYSSIRILPDLVCFEGYIRIHRHQGKIVCPVPRKIDDSKAQDTDDTDETNHNKPEQEEDSQTPDHNELIHDVDDSAMSAADHSVANANINNAKDDRNDNNVEIKRNDSGWFQSFSSFATNAKKSLNKLQTMYEAQTIEFDSDFPFVLRDSAIHNLQMDAYVLHDDRFLDLFEPLPMKQTMDQNLKQQQGNALPLNEQWEFCAVKIHHETLFIRYANKWITLPLNNIEISPFESDCTGFIVDYQTFFTISEDKGYVLLCQHLEDPHIELPVCDTECAPIQIPYEHALCPWPYVQRYVIGFRDTSYVSMRKKQVLKCIVQKVSNAMKDDGFDNHALSYHAIQFRTCINAILSNIKGAQKALAFNEDRDVNMSNAKQEMSDDDNDLKQPDEDNEEHKSESNPPLEEQKQVFLPYLQLLNEPYHGLNIHQLSASDWHVAAEASWLSNYVYDIHKPLHVSSQNQKPRRNSWSHFRSYMSMGSSASNLHDVVSENNSNNRMENDADEDEIEYRGPPHLRNDSLWKQHSDKHYRKLSKFGFELLDYAITQRGQSVQFMITRSYDNPNTIYLSFKGTSNPLDGMVNIGLHPLELPQFECSVFSGMYAALQQSLSFVCGKLHLYSSDEYFENNKSNNTTKIYKLVISGHSLGGGYAQLFLAHLLSVSEFKEYFESIKCMTFGSPLVFCSDVRNSFLYDELNAMCLNFVYQFDLVPRLQNGMSNDYRCKLLQDLLLSQLPGPSKNEYIGIVFDINERLNYILHKFEEHQWLMDRYCCVGKYCVLFEKDEPRSIDKQHPECFTKSAKSCHMVLD